MFILSLLCLGLFTAVLYPATPIGKQLRAVLIEAPASLVSKITWAKAIVSAAVTAFFLGALFIGFNMHDGVVVFMMLPEVLVWMAAFDIATLLELSIVVMFAASSIRVGAAARFAVAKAARVFALLPVASTKSARERRAKPRRPDRSAGDDDAPGPLWGYAFA